MFAEGDRVRLAVATAAQLIDDAARSVELAAGSAGFVVLVHPAGTECQSYEVEFQTADGVWAIARIPEANLAAL